MITILRYFLKKVSFKTTFTANNIIYILNLYNVLNNI